MCRAPFEVGDPKKDPKKEFAKPFALIRDTC